MKKPNSIKKNEVIALSSMSDGITKETKKEKLLKTIAKLEGDFIIKQDKHLFSSRNGESCNALTRAQELTELILDDSVKCVMSITGGNYLVEILDYLDLAQINKNVKWLQGQSDATILLYVVTTKYDIQTIYSYNANALSSISDLEYNNNLNILKGKKIIQKDFGYMINDGERKVSEWKSSQNIELTGRIIGGCLECLIDLVGTKYDYTNKFIEKYKNDGIIWYFDIDYMTNEQLLRNLWHLESLGWFKYAKCIIFGRLIETSFTNITLDEAINRGLKNTNVPIITNFDLGHTYPRITIVNGSKIQLTYNEDTHTIKIID